MKAGLLLSLGLELTLLMPSIRLLGQPASSIDPMDNWQTVIQLMDTMTLSGIPGMVLAVESSDTRRFHAAGFANLEARIPMQDQNLHYLQSISKMYIGVATLKLFETGALQLDSPITAYLDPGVINLLPNPSSITVRMLLNHTSGLPEYNFRPAYVTRLLQHPDYPFERMDYLSYIRGKPADFPPGDHFAYRNTNYVLLSLLLDKVTGDHAKWMQYNLFQPLSLKHTLYHTTPDYLEDPALVNSYWDRYGDGILENASELQRHNVAALWGDDGVVATAWDAIGFLKSLVDENFLKDSTWQLMQQWAKDRPGEDRYGLGLDLVSKGGISGYGHSGGGIGAGCELYYFPEKKTYVFIAINLGVVTESPLHAGLEDKLERLYRLLLQKL